MTMTAMGWGLIAYIATFLLVGIGMVAMVKGSGKRYIICGKSLPFFFVGTMLLAQAIDANSTMGCAAGTYTGGFWTGFTFPFGLFVCLVVTGLFFAKPLNRMNLLTLPDFYFRRYSSLTELIVSLLMGFSFIILVAGNFAGSGWIIAYTFNMEYVWALIIISVFIFVYTVAGGLFSCAATDIVQIYPALFGFVGCWLWLQFHYGWDFFASAIPPEFLDLSGLTKVENGALVNWAGILALGFGDIVALDFMERIFSSRDGKTAQISCFYAAVLTLLSGVASAFVGLFGLKLFPEVADTRMIMPSMAMTAVPFIFGLFMMAGVIGAGASTANGGILGVSTVMGRNILQKNILRWYRNMQGTALHVEHTEEARKRFDAKLLMVSRLMAIPVVAVAIWLAYVKPEPGILLVLAFDVVFAGCLVPLVLGIWWKKANTPGALAAIVVGSLLRLYLYYNIPEELAGLDTMIPPVVSLLVMVPVSLMTQQQAPPKFEAITTIPDEADVLAGVC